MNFLRTIILTLALMVIPFSASAQLTGPQGGTGVPGISGGSIPFGGTSILRIATSSSFQYSNSLSRLTVTNASTTALTTTTLCLNTCETSWPTASFDSTAVDATTWSDGTNASNIWTFNLSGTDTTLTFGSDLFTFSGSLTLATGKNFTIGSTAWNTGDALDIDVASLDTSNDDFLDVAAGGTGVGTLTDGGVLLGNATGDFVAMSVLANGAIIVGDGTTDPVALTAFTSSTGDLIHEAGGLEADVSAYTNGLYGQLSGATADVDTIAEIETAIGGATNILTETEIDASSELAALMDDETGTAGALMFSVGPTMTGTTTMARASSSLWYGGGLTTDCDGDTQALGYDLSTQMFTCGDDDSGAGGGITTIQENDSDVTTAATTIDFGTGFDVTGATGEGDIALDLTEYTGDATIGGGDLTIGATAILTGGDTTSLDNIDAINATTESTIEAAIDTLANLTSVQGQTISLSAPLTLAADPNADRFLFWDDSAGGTAYLAPDATLSISGTTLSVVDLTCTGCLTTTEIASLDIGDDTNLAAGRSLTLTGDTVDADAELYTDTKCIWFENPTAADDFKSIWANKTANAVTITEIWAESDQTVAFDLQVDDGTPADVNGTDITPAAGEAEDTTLSGDTTLDANEELDLAITSVTNTPTWFSACWTFTWND